MAGPTRSPTPHPRARFLPACERLERRALMAGTAPTDAEQYMLEWINRARANPSAEGQRLLALAQSDPVLRQATAGEDLGLFYRTISSYAPEPPLAFNTRLIDAALAEDASMLARNGQEHSPTGFLNNPAVAVASDGLPYYPTGSGWWATGENIFAFSANVAGSSLTRYVDYFEAGFLLDWGNPDFGHLKNLLAPGPAEGLPANPSATAYPLSEVGIGLMANAYPTVPPEANPSNPANAGLNVGPALVAQEFGWHTGAAFLTGTFFVDKLGTGFYAPGEGLGGLTIAATGTAGQGTFLAQTWSTGGYSLALPPGTYLVSATGNLPGGARSTVATIGLDNVGWEVAVAPTPADIPVPADYDGIGHAEFATYQPATGNWSINSPLTGPRVKAFGLPGDIPVPGRYDGGTRTEIAVFRPSTATWYIIGPAGLRVIPFGRPGAVPVPGDYDGDGKTDLAVYDPANGTWSILGSKAGTTQVKAFGIPGLDQPVPAAYDGGGVTEIAVLRPTTYQWFIIGPTGVRVVQFGCPGAVPVPAPYDGGGKAEVAVFLPANAGLYILNNATFGTFIPYGIPGVDQPIPADYDGDGNADVAVFRPGNAEWFVKGSRGGWIYAQYGQGGPPQTLKALASTTAAIPAGWANWVGAPAAASTEGFGPIPVEADPAPPAQPIHSSTIPRHGFFGRRWASKNA